MPMLHYSRKLLFRVMVLAMVSMPEIVQAIGSKDPRRIEKQTNLTLDEAVVKIADVLIVFLPTVAAVYLIISGYRYMAAQGNPDLVEKAKKSLLYSVFGFVVAIVSVGLIITISRALGFNSGLRI